MNDISELTEYDPARYDGWTLDDITGSLRGASLNLLKRGSSASLIARREWGGMLVAASKLVTRWWSSATVPPYPRVGLQRRPHAHEAVGPLATCRQDAARSGRMPAGVVCHSSCPATKAVS